MSLLEYLIHCIRKSDMSLLGFTNELIHCELASKIEMAVILQKVKEFETGLEKVKKEVKKAEENIAI